MARNLLETIMGAVVLIVAIAFLIFAYERSAVKTVNGYQIEARFSDVTGIGAGSDVRVGGMKVGTVDALSLDEKTYQATLHMQIRDTIKLPKDSSASISSSGLLGDKFVKLEPGGNEAMLKQGDVIRFTQSSVSFEDLIGKFVFSGGGVDDKSSQNTPAPAPEASDEESEKSNPFSLGL